MPPPWLPELVELEQIIEEGAAHLDARSVCDIEVNGCRLPVLAIHLGNPDPGVPAVGFFGGIHGLERIGTQVLVAFLGSLLARLDWDDVLHRQLESVRMVFMPLINPGGMSQATRCNPNGVDLMRNAPVESLERVPFLLGGQRLTPRLPWYRGHEGTPMEAENQAVCRIVETELLSRDFSLALDCHSGFGLRDRIWFPLAHSTAPIPHLADIHALKDLYDRTYPQHDYLFEPQSAQYLTHGDLWDHLYLQSIANGSRTFLPLTLEMGSWNWIRKSPRQALSLLGIFNPLASHRQQRVLRRHLVWLDFLARAASSHRHWLPAGVVRHEQEQAALSHWYRHHR